MTFVTRLFYQLACLLRSGFNIAFVCMDTPIGPALEWPTLPPHSLIFYVPIPWIEQNW
jgi:hypothetical protein